MPPGRPRSRNSQRAILAATVELLEEAGWSRLTIEKIAARAGVGKQTIYRWYDGDLGRIVVEAYIDASDERVEIPDTGSVRADLTAIVVPVAAMNSNRGSGLALANRSLMAHAQVSDLFAAQYRALHEHWRDVMLAAVRRGVDRGELVAETDPDLVVDQLLGLQWYRLLVGHLPTTEDDAVESVDTALAYWTASSSSSNAPRTSASSSSKPSSAGA
jgi:AcrR family transcriptional regulator